VPKSIPANVGYHAFRKLSFLVTMRWCPRHPERETAEGWATIVNLGIAVIKDGGFGAPAACSVGKRLADAQHLIKTLYAIARHSCLSTWRDAGRYRFCDAELA